MSNHVIYKNSIKWRNELKYYISDRNIILLKHKLSNLLPLDYNSNGGSYLVRSLYFDDPFNSGISNKLDGIEKRSRFRIRLYNKKNLKIESKVRQNQAITKLSSWISVSQYKSFVSPDSDSCVNLKKHDLAIRSFLISKKKYSLRPKLIVEYDRTAFIIPGTDIRITLDLNLRTYKSSINLINPNTKSIPIFMFPSQQILEIKFSNYLPRYVTKIIESFNLNRYAISKYALCARYIRTNSWEDN